MKILNFDQFLQDNPTLSGSEAAIALKSWIAAWEAAEESKKIKPKTCQSFDTWTIIGKNNEVQFKIPVCLSSGKCE